MKKIFSLFAAVLFAGSLLATDYHLEQVSSVSVGKTYAFVRNDKALSTTGSNVLKTSDVNYGTIDGTQDYLWKLVAADDSVKLQNLSKPTEKVSGETKDAFLRNSSSSNLSITSAEGSNLWKIKFADDDDWAMIVSSAKFIGETSTGAGTYKAYANNESNLGSHPYKLEVYELKEGASTQPSILAADLDLKTLLADNFPFNLDTSIVVEASDLAADISISVKGENLEVPASLSKDGGKLEFSVKATAEAQFTDSIILTAGTLVKKVAVKANIVDPEGEGSEESPFTLADLAKINNGLSGKWWTQGFILGCAKTGGVIQDDPTKIDSSSVLLGATANATEGIAVQLATGSQAQKDVREALAIKGSTGKIGKEVKVCGKLESYFGTTGIKNTDAFAWVESEQPKSTDATIKWLKVDGQDVAELDGIFRHEFAADLDLFFTEVTFELNDPNATAVPASGYQVEIPNSSTDTTKLLIEVTAEDDVTTMNYMVYVTRAASGPGDMTDATIAWLKVDGEVVTEDESHEYHYEIPANFANQYVEVTFQLSSPEATSNPDANESFLIEVPASSEVEPSKAQITVQSGDGSIEIIYWVVVTRAALDPEASTDATIAWLKIDGVAVEAVNDVFEYEATAEAAGSNVEVTFELNDSKAIANKQSGFSAAVPASHDAAAIETSLTVTAENPAYQKTYTIRLTVAEEEQGIEDIVLTEKVQKVVVDGAVYIIRDNKMYNVLGGQVK